MKMSFVPSIDLQETDNAYVVQIEMPKAEGGKAGKSIPIETEESS